MRSGAVDLPARVNQAPVGLWGQAPERGKKDLLRWSDRSGNRTAESLRVLCFVNRIAGKLLGEFFQVLDGQFGLFLSAGGEGQQNSGERFQVIAVVGCLFHLRHAQRLIPMNAAKPQNKSR